MGRETQLERIKELTPADVRGFGSVKIVVGHGEAGAKSDCGA
jgi:hypothetical protein